MMARGGLRVRLVRWSRRAVLPLSILVGNHFHRGSGEGGEPGFRAGQYDPSFHGLEAFNGMNDQPLDYPRTLIRNVTAHNSGPDRTPTPPHLACLAWAQ